MSLTLFLIFAILLIAFGVIFAVWFEASGRMFGHYDAPEMIELTAEAEGLNEVEAFIRDEFHTKPAALTEAGKTRLDLLAEKRKLFETFGLSREFDAEFVSVDNPRGEWVLTPGADPNKRLIYYHGGGFTVGSPRSHRPIAVRMGQALGATVFLPDYRLMPEHSRLAPVEDARAAYRWILDSGPDGQAPVERLYVAGDSAGGSLSLMVLQWARDAGLRAADGCVGFSPSSDTTLSGPNIRRNFHTDTMLQPLIKPFLDVPGFILPFAAWRIFGARPTDARISPLFGDLADLPPTLIQVAATELLYDDAYRYAAKAQAQGSPVTLEVWTGPDGSPPLPHVWMMFDRELPAARRAINRAAAFLNAS